MEAIALRWRATLFVPVVLSAISCERLPTTTDRVAGSRPSFAVVPGSGSWTTKAPMPTARYGLGVAAVNGILYAVGGGTQNGAILATVEAYDPAINTWTTQAPMPTARTYLGVAAVNGILYAVGGAYVFGPRTTVEAYDPGTNTWTSKVPMPTARYLLGVAAVNGILYAVGGYTGFQWLATVEAYDPVTNTWTTKAPMPTARFGLGVAAVNGILYAVGGANSLNGGELATVEAYDPATNTWTTKAPMPTARYELGVAAMNGIVYAVGGTANNVDFLATLEAYDPATNTWTMQASMPTARGFLGVDAIISSLYAVGGYNGTTVSANEAFTPLALGPPATLTLSPLTATNTVGAQHCVTATVQDAARNPVPGVTVRFSVGPSVPTTFPSPSSGSSTTNASGQATFCYTASLPGVDRIHAFADADGNGTQDPGEPFGDAEKTWTPPASTQLCEVTITDGGWIIADNTDRANFGGNAKVLADGTVQGQQQYQDDGPTQPMNVQSTQITATTCSQDRTTASIFGNATIDGAGSHVFRIDVSDAGSGGANDTYGIRLDTGYMSGQHQLGGGNITIH
jgi:Kelch motif/Bacterial Ig-like domain (group 1)